MTATAGQPDVDKTAGEVAAFAKDAVAAGRPLFLIIHYEHEAIKIAFSANSAKPSNSKGSRHKRSTLANAPIRGRDISTHSSRP